MLEIQSYTENCVKCYKIVYQSNSSINKTAIEKDLTNVATILRDSTNIMSKATEITVHHTTDTTLSYINIITTINSKASETLNEEISACLTEAGFKVQDSSEIIRSGVLEILIPQINPCATESDTQQENTK